MICLSHQSKAAQSVAIAAMSVQGFTCTLPNIAYNAKGLNYYEL